jgi:hypothetical protein
VFELWRVVVKRSGGMKVAVNLVALHKKVKAEGAVTGLLGVDGGSWRK